jgi:LacI family transcriptional regulator
MKGKKSNNQDIIVHPTYVVTRRSTSTFVIEDKAVAGAVKFIYKNARNMLNVNDVVNSGTVSRRVLEMRFKSILGRSILDEIKLVRSDLIAQTLLKNNASISDVAISLGFPNANHMSRYFHREKKINPLAYRQLHSMPPIP